MDVNEVGHVDIVERNRDDLGISRKYQMGAIHELATGKFEITDRFKDKNGNVMLEYKWITGDKTDRVETNKETNLNASLHKYRISRGKPTIQRFDNMGERMDYMENRLDEIEDKIDEVFQLVNKGVDFVEQNNKYIVAFDTILEKLDRCINGVEFNKQVLQNTDYDEEFKSMKNIIREQEQLIQSLSSQIQQIILGSDLVEKQQETLNRQQELLNKLVDKLA